MIIVEITIEQATITIQDKVVTAMEDTTIAEVGLMAPGDGNEEAMTVIGVDRQVEIENTEVTLLTDVTIIRTIAMTTEDRIIGGHAVAHRGTDMAHVDRSASVPR